MPENQPYQEVIMPTASPSGRDLGDFRGRLVLDRIELTGPLNFPTGPARAGILHEPLPADYYRRERLPPSAGGHARHDLPHVHETHAPPPTSSHATASATAHETASHESTGGTPMSANQGSNGLTMVFVFLGAIFVIGLLAWLFFGPYSIRTSPTIVTLTATPTGTPYDGPQTNIPAYQYTGKSCIRADGSVGREGKLGAQLGCWKN